MTHSHNDQLVKYNLFYAYKIAAHLKLDDHTYTHLSARIPGANYYYIYPFGLTFDEVTPNNLLKVSLDGKLLEGSEYQYNKTGYVIHGSIYESRADISAIFHIHTPYTVAVSALEEGLMPISQWALHFYGNISYHDYNSLALNYEDHKENLSKDLDKNYVMFLRNHGVITCGKTMHEAMFYLYHLENACKAQILALSCGRKLIIPSSEICQKANLELLSFEQDLGKRDWDAWVRVLKLHENY